MNVEQPAEVVVNKARGQYAHESGQDDQLRMVTVDQRRQSLVKLLAVVKLLVIQYRRFNSRGLRPLKAKYTWTITDYRADLNWQIGCGLVDKGLQVGSPA